VVTSGNPPAITVTRTPVTLWLLSLATLTFEGYDVYIYGAAVPSLLRRADWALSGTFAGWIGSTAAFGMLIGSLASGLLTNRFGRRRVYLATVIVFSVGSALCALAPSPWLLLAARLVVGLGAGGFIPTALAMVVEYSPGARKNLTTAVAAVGMGLGAGLGGLIAIMVLPMWGYQALFWIGAAPLVLIVPVAMARVPESVSLLLARGEVERAHAQVHRYRLPIELTPPAPAQPPPQRESLLAAARTLLGGEHARATILFWAANALSLLLVFGSYTWLTTIMENAGYGITGALTFFILLQVGALIGALGGALLSDRHGPKAIVLLSFGCAAFGLITLAAKPPTLAVYLLVVLVGVGAGGTQCLLYAYIATYYPPTSQDNGLGLASAFGRLGGIAGPYLGGALQDAGATPAQNFLVFAIAPLLALGLLTLGPRVRPTSSA
jgi:MFS transporter, AAHS family, benzoate transport protein